MRNLLYLVAFFTITPITILTSAFTLRLVSNIHKDQINQENKPVSLGMPRYGSRIFAALPETAGEVAGATTAADGRVEIIRQYLETYRSPLLPYAQNLVGTAERYGLDFRLLVAIAQQESNLCKKIPDGSYNCWGWGVHSRGTLKFTGYSEAIEAVAKGIREEYVDKGYTTPEEIMAKYTPLSPGTWAAGVRQFLEEME